MGNKLELKGCCKVKFLNKRLILLSACLNIILINSAGRQLYCDIFQEDTILDDSDPRLVIQHKHHHHSLVLLSIDNSTVGRYYCVASNSYGQATKSILVTGKPSNIRAVSER